MEELELLATVAGVVVAAGGAAYLIAKPSGTQTMTAAPVTAPTPAGAAAAAPAAPVSPLSPQALLASAWQVATVIYPGDQVRLAITPADSVALSAAIQAPGTAEEAFLQPTLQALTASATTSQGQEQAIIETLLTQGPFSQMMALAPGSLTVFMPGGLALPPDWPTDDAPNTNEIRAEYVYAGNSPVWTNALPVPATYWTIPSSAGAAPGWPGGGAPAPPTGGAIAPPAPPTGQAPPGAAPQWTAPPGGIPGWTGPVIAPPTGGGAGAPGAPTGGGGGAPGAPTGGGPGAPGAPTGGGPGAPGAPTGGGAGVPGAPTGGGGGWSGPPSSGSFVSTPMKSGDHVALTITPGDLSALAAGLLPTSPEVPILQTALQTLETSVAQGQTTAADARVKFVNVLLTQGPFAETMHIAPGSLVVYWPGALPPDWPAADTFGPTAIRARFVYAGPPVDSGALPIPGQYWVKT